MKEQNDLLEKVRYYFELMDAMNTVHSLLLSSVFRQAKRYGAYRRLVIMVEKAENELRELL